MPNALKKSDGNEPFAVIPLSLAAGLNNQQFTAQQQMYQTAYERAKAQVARQWDEGGSTDRPVKGYNSQARCRVMTVTAAKDCDCSR
ncbi:MAG: hypothetical protein EHM48_00310 [Planctomycetaceae bacterium]|nr:MAG: hypothetical protein EHM48_00310 [Planctomycetaceae bacterium]